MDSKLTGATSRGMHELYLLERGENNCVRFNVEESEVSSESD